MQHIFEWVITKKEGSEDMTPISRMYVSDSKRNSKVAKKIQEAVIKLGIVKKEEIENLYLHLLR